MKTADHTRIEIHSGPDDHGRYVHTRYWVSGYHPGHPDGEHRLAERGQVFRSELPPGWAAAAALSSYAKRKAGVR